MIIPQIVMFTVYSIEGSMIPRNQAVLHPSLVQVYSGDDLSIILEMFEAFEEYWLSGYMYEFGLDTPLDRPSSAKASGLCHVHVLYNEELFTDNDYREWERKSSPNIPPSLRSKRMNCDSMIIYSMSREGTALFLTFYPSLGHERIKHGTVELGNLAIVSEDYFSSIDENPASYEEVMEFLQQPT